MTVHLQRELDGLRKLLSDLTAAVMKNTEQALLAYDRLDVNQASLVIEADRAIDLEEVRVEEECLKILALHEPKADDLRFVFEVSKINHELERIGDLAANIAGAVMELANAEKITVDLDIPALAERSQRLVEQSIEAMVELDVEKARSAWMSDEEIDQQHRDVNQQIKAALAEHPQHGAALLSLRSIAACLERIADHGANIAKAVIYMATGEIVRHRSQEFRVQ